MQPRGELDLATVKTLRSTLDAAIAETLRAAPDGIEGRARLVLDLRGLSFIDSTGLHLLVALHKRAQRDGFELTVIAPAAPIDRAIQLCRAAQDTAVRGAVRPFRFRIRRIVTRGSWKRGVQGSLVTSRPAR